MRQSTFQMVAILCAFVFYTTMKGNLRGYLSVMGIV